MSLLSDHDLYLFNEGSHVKLYDRLGSHPRTMDGTEGTNFAVWAPDAERVYVMGSFNGWDKGTHPMRPSPVEPGRRSLKRVSIGRSCMRAELSTVRKISRG